MSPVGVDFIILYPCEGTIGLEPINVICFFFFFLFARVLVYGRLSSGGHVLVLSFVVGGI